MIMTSEEIKKFEINKKLEMAEDELHEIELTADKTKRIRWRELKKIIKYYKSVLK